jgi:hypothetical protein
MVSGAVPRALLGMPPSASRMHWGHEPDRHSERAADWEVGDTADWKSALRGRGSWRAALLLECLGTMNRSEDKNKEEDEDEQAQERGGGPAFVKSNSAWQARTNESSR